MSGALSMSNIPTTVTIAGGPRAVHKSSHGLSKRAMRISPLSKNPFGLPPGDSPGMPLLDPILNPFGKHSAMSDGQPHGRDLNLISQLRGGAGRLGEFALGDNASHFGPLRGILYHERNSRPGSVQGSLHFADALTRPHNHEGLCRGNKRVGAAPGSNDSTDFVFRSHDDEHLPAG